MSGVMGVLSYRIGRRRGRCAWERTSFNGARGFMFALGCIQALRCHTNTCPTGVTTHNRRLQRGLVVEEESVRVANYAINMN